MKKPDTWMPVYPADYLSKTAHLNAEQHGAYFLLLLHGWKHAGRLPPGDTQLFQITRMTPKQWKVSRDVLMGFFDRDPNGYTQNRQIEEMAKAVSMTTAKSAGGKVGAERRWQKHGKSNDKTIGVLLGNAMTEDMPERWDDDAPSPTPPPKAKARSTPTREPPSAFAPPEWVPRQEWDDFDEMRRSKSGKGWTFNAKGLAVNELEKLKVAGHDIAAVLRQSTMRTYAGLFPVESKGKQTVADKRSATAKAMYAHRKDDADDDIPGDAERIP